MIFRSVPLPPLPLVPASLEQLREQVFHQARPSECLQPHPHP